MAELDTHTKKKITQKQPILFANILSFVDKFCYDTEQNSQEKIQSELKNEKSKVLSKLDNKNTQSKNVVNPNKVNYIKTKNLKKLLEVVLQIDKAIYLDNQDRQSISNEQKVVVPQLFELIKQKLGDDAYKFYIQFCCPLLNKKINKKDYNFELPILLFFNCILENISQYFLARNINFFDLEQKLAEELSLTIDIECQIRDILSNAINNNSNIGNSTQKIDTKNLESKEKIITLIYLYLLLKYRGRIGFDKFSILVERVIVQGIIEFQNKDFNQLSIKILPEALISNHKNNELKKLSFLYYDTTNNNFALHSTNKELNNQLQTLKKDLSSCYLQQKELENKNDIQNKKFEVLNKEYSILKEELAKTKNRLEFEIEKYEKQIRGLKSGIYSKMKENLQIELNGIENIAKRLPDEFSQKLSLWVDNLYQILNASGETN